MDEKEIVKRAQQGDEECFSMLYERHYDKVYGVVYKFLGNNEDTEDVTQDTFIKAYINLGKFKGNSAFATWVHRIGANNAKNFLLKKSNRVQKVSIVPEDLEEMFTDHHCPEEEVSVEELKNVLEEATKELSQEQREVYILADFQKMTYKQISEMLDIPVGTVRSRLFKARSFINEEYEDWKN